MARSHSKRKGQTAKERTRPPAVLRTGAKTDESLNLDRFEELGACLPAWAGNEVRRTVRILAGRDPKVRAILRDMTKLRDKLRSLSSRSGSSVAASVAADLVEVVGYANDLGRRIGEILHAEGRAKRAEVRSALSLIYEIELPLLRRRADRLRKKIPDLIEELGGDPSKELLLPPSRANRPRRAVSKRKVGSRKRTPKDNR